MKTFRKLALHLAVVAASQPVFADDKQADHIFELDKMTVAATLTEKNVDAVASSVTVISDQTMAHKGDTDIRDLVRYEPGVEVQSHSRFGINGFNIRGLDENQVKIVVDGVDQAEAFIPVRGTTGVFQRANRNYVDVDSLKRVDIVKGPASSLYGSNAIGGVVAFTTKDPADYLKKSGDDTAFKLKTEYTSEDQGKHGTFTAANRSGDLESLLVYTKRDFHEVENRGQVGGDGTARTRNNPANNEQYNLLGKLQYQLSEAHRIGLTLEDYQANSESDLRSVNAYNDYSRFFGPGNYLNYADTHVDDTTERKRIGVQHEWQANLPLFDKINWQLGRQESTTANQTFDTIAMSSLVQRMFRLDPGPRLKDYAHEDESLQFSARLNKQLQQHLLTYGLSYEDNKLTNSTKTHYLDGSKASEMSRYIPLVDGRTWGAYLQDEISLLNERLDLTAGIRYDSFEAKPKSDTTYTTTASEHESDKFSLRVGNVYHLTDAWSVYGQYAQGFKTPDIFSLYYERDGGTYKQEPNPDLKPEESDSFEVGVRHQSPLADMELSAFYNQYDNYIEVVRINNDAPYVQGLDRFENISEATIKGVEWRGSLWLDQLSSAPKGTSFQWSLAYADGEGEEQGERYSLDEIAPLKGVFSLHYDRPDQRWGSALYWTLVDAKKAADVSDSSYALTDGYGLVDLSAYWKVTPEVELRGAIYNLTDANYSVWEDVRGASNTTNLDRFTQPGRHFNVSVSYAF